MMGRTLKYAMRTIGLIAALTCLVATQASALTFANPIPDKEIAYGFDVPTPAAPDYLLSTDLANDFLSASPDPSSGADIIFTVTDCLLYAGASGCQGSVPEGVGPYTGITTWTVSAINVPVPEDGLLLLIGGMGNGETPVISGNPPAPDYQLGSVQVLTDGGVLGGMPLPALDEMLLTFGAGQDYVYYGTKITQVTDSLTFGYTVDEQLAGGTPIFFSNAARSFVPEPGTAILVGAGLFALSVRRTSRADRPSATGRRRS
jgi:hypothetical protein